MTLALVGFCPALPPSACQWLEREPRFLRDLGIVHAEDRSSCPPCYCGARARASSGIFSGRQGVRGQQGSGLRSCRRSA
eukprot:9433309-Alexandrium_andersonii.AAC.1